MCRADLVSEPFIIYGVGGGGGGGGENWGS